MGLSEYQKGKVLRETIGGTATDVAHGAYHILGAPAYLAGYVSGMRPVSDQANPSFVGNPAFAPSIPGMTDVGTRAFDVLGRAPESMNPNMVGNPAYLGESPENDFSFFRGLAGMSETPDQAQPVVSQPIQTAPTTEPLSTPPPPTPQPTAPTQGSGFEGGGGVPVPVVPLLAPLVAQQGAKFFQNRIESAPAGPPAFAQAPAPHTYSDQVAENLRKPFMEKYNSLRYGAPLDFESGTDPRVIKTSRANLGDAQGTSIAGGNALEIRDRPLSLSELDPMMVQEKDWGAYLKAVVSAASTPEFDASKDPAVLQQVEQMNAAYWKFKSAQKEQKMLESRRKLLEAEARDMEYRAGIRQESEEEREKFLEDQAEEKAKFLEKQARLLDNRDWSQGYSDEEKQAVSDQAAKLREQAKLIRNGSEAERDQAREQTSAEHKLWWSEQVAKLREGHQRLNEEVVATEQSKAMSKQDAALSHQGMLAVGQIRDEDRRQQEAALAYQTTQRELALRNRAAEAQEQKSKGEISTAKAAASYLKSEAGQLQNELNQYTQTPDGQIARKDDPLMTPLPAQEAQQIKQKAARLSSLLKRSGEISAHAVQRQIQMNPDAADLIGGPVPESAPVEAPVAGQPGAVLQFPTFASQMRDKGKP